MLRLKIRAITAEGRLSAIFLSVMPFLLFGVVTLLQPTYYTGVSGNPIFMPSIIVGLIMLFLGNVIIYRMVHFKV
jgi:tight adherence protein B